MQCAVFFLAWCVRTNENFKIWHLRGAYVNPYEVSCHHTVHFCRPDPYEVSCHHTVHFCRPEEISSFFFHIWPSWSLKKRKACGFWLLVKQILSNLLSIRLTALPKAHSAHPWSWWCLVEHQWCRMQEAPPVFSITVCTHSSQKRSCHGWATAA